MMKSEYGDSAFSKCRSTWTLQRRVVDGPGLTEDLSVVQMRYIPLRSQHLILNDNGGKLANRKRKRERDRDKLNSFSQPKHLIYIS